MLRLENIVKDYQMKGASVRALKGISLCFRKNEFVSVLGPSGCGKTTLLNILGGLDHYTSGDLFIEGRSTKDFRDHDWDIYRNHRIGFIFQSYNLIPHENILENVELALTIGGVSMEERERRAKTALDRVGLKDLYKKMPNQLSGGQCQRVAIARALVNEPEILLADEPTGALDSKTSVQIMELIQEISKEKLVIMVTHNPELAKQYSTRIVSLLDGEIEQDTNPYTPEEEKQERDISVSEEEQQKEEKKEKAKMSWWTSFKLSAKNLWSKARRTTMVVIASSIGIVGVSAVLSVSNGVTGYIDGMQDEMLSGNPVSVAKESFDLSAITSQMTNTQTTELVQEAAKDGYVNVDFMTQRLIESAKQMGSSMIQNTITQDYVDFIEEMPKEYYQDIVKSYGLDLSNNLYTKADIHATVDQTFQEAIGNGSTNIDNDITSLGTVESDTYSLSTISSVATAILGKKLSETDFGSYASLVSDYADTFSQSINNEDYLLSQYDVVEGKIAQEENEIMVVLSNNDAITDFTLTLLGFFSQDDFLNIVYKYTLDDDGNPDERYDDAAYQRCKEISISTLMNKEFTYYPNNIAFRANKDSSGEYSTSMPFVYFPNPYSGWEGKGMDLKVVGVIKPKEGRQYTTLNSGFLYTPKFAERFIKDNYTSNLSQFVRDYDEKSMAGGGTGSGYSSVQLYAGTMPTGVFYSFDYSVEGETIQDNYALVGSSSSLSALFASIGGGSTTGGSVATLTENHIGANNLPYSIRFYPNSFDDKFMVTDYLDQWNSDKTLTIKGREISASDRDEIKYTDNLQVVISMINNIINIITIALICFTALSLVVSTVMIGIITYVSVMERIKEIGIIRALGGRKKDVSHLFNAETFIIGFSAGLFGILVTYLLQTILNLIVHGLYPPISSIASLSWIAALIIILISVLLTVIAGLIPSRSAARKDPVEALRTE